MTTYAWDFITTPIWDTLEDDHNRVDCALDFYEQNIIQKHELFTLLREIEIDKITFDDTIRLYDLQFFGADQLIAKAKSLDESFQYPEGPRIGAFCSLFDKGVISKEPLMDEVKRCCEKDPYLSGSLCLRLVSMNVITSAEARHVFGIK